MFQQKQRKQLAIHLLLSHSYCTLGLRSHPPEWFFAVMLLEFDDRAGLFQLRLAVFRKIFADFFQHRRRRGFD